MSSLRDLPFLPCHRDLMTASPGKLFSAPGWIHELKYDGFRCCPICKHGQTLRLQSRNGPRHGRLFRGTRRRDPDNA